MLKTIQADCETIKEAVEHIQDMLGRMKLPQKVDVAAQLRPILHKIEAIDTSIKDEIKKERKHSAGVVLGELFKAHLAYIPTTILNQQLLLKKDPKVYAKYLETNDVGRITFESK